MMNNGHLQSMAGLGGQATLQQQHNMTARGVQFPHLMRIMESNPVPAGWQQTLPLANRVHFVSQLLTSLRITRPNLPANDAVAAVIHIELSALHNSPDQGTYDNHCGLKLSAFNEERAQSVQNQQLQRANFAQAGGMRPMAMRAGMSNQPQPQPQVQAQPQPGFPNPQLQRPMQASPMPIQSQPSMGQLGNPMAPVQGTPQMQNTPQQQMKALQLADISPQDRATARQLAEHLKRSNQQTYQRVNQHFLNMPAEERPLMMSAAESLDRYYLIQALKLMSNQRTQNAAGQGPAFGQQGHGVIRMPNGLQPQQGAPNTGVQGFDSQFGGNYQDIGNQALLRQQEAIRMQKKGQMVVPQTAQQISNQQRLQQIQQKRAAAGQPNPLQQQDPNGSNMVQRRNVNQFQVDSMARARAQAAQIQYLSPQNSLQGQVGGLNASANQVHAQASPNIQTLNRSMQDASQQGRVTGTPQQRPLPTPTPDQVMPVQFQRPVQQMPGGPPNGQQNMLHENLPETWANITLPMHQALLNLPSEARASAYGGILKVQAERQRAQQNAVAANGGNRGHVGLLAQPGHQVAPGSQGVSRPQQGQGQGQGPGQGQNIQAHSVQHPSQAQSMGQQRSADTPALTPEKMRYMDGQIFPSDFVAGQMKLDNIPSNVKNWGELKQWITANHNSPATIVNLIKEVQRKLYIQMLNKAIRARTEAPNQAQGQNQTSQSILQGSNPAQLQQTQARKAAEANGAVQAQMMAEYRVRAAQATTLAQSQHQRQEQAMMLQAQQLQQKQAQNPSQIPVPGQQQAAAPVANMAPGRPRANDGGQTFLLPANVPSPPVLTDEQVATLRSRHKSQLHQTDAQIRDSYAKRCYVQWLQAHRQKAFNGLIKPPQDSRGPQTPLMNDGQLPPGQNQRATQAGGSLTGQQNGTQSNTAASTNIPQAGSQTPKNIKRTSTDDVEIPNLRQAQQRQQNLGSHVQRSGPGFSHLSPVQAAGHPRPPAPSSAAKKEAPNMIQLAPQKVAQLHREFQASIPQQPIVAMDEMTRKKAQRLLTNSKELFQKSDQIFRSFWEHTRDENMLKDVVKSRVLLLRQFADSDFHVVDHLTLSLSDIEAKIGLLQRAANIAFQKVKQLQASQVQQAQDPAVTTPQPPPTQPTAGQQSKTTAIPRNQGNRDARPPAAPTSDRAPFSFSNRSSPNRIPQRHGPSDLTADQLTIPPAKKRKLGKDATSSPIVAKKPSPSTAPAAPVYICDFSGCESGKVGFALGSELLKHHETHKVVDPPITDGLEYALEGMRIALQLDKSGSSKARPLADVPIDKVATAPGMKPSPSTHGLTPNMKSEGGTPMSRVPTANLSSLGVPKTPQPNGIARSPSSDTKAFTTSKSGPTSAPKVEVEPIDMDMTNGWEYTALGADSDYSNLFPTPDELQFYDNLTPDDLTPDTTIISPTSSSGGISSPLPPIPTLPAASFDPHDTAWMEPCLGGLVGPDVQTAWSHGDALFDMSWDEAFPDIEMEPEAAKGKKGLRKKGMLEMPFDSSLYTIDLTAD